MFITCQIPPFSALLTWEKFRSSPDKSHFLHLFIVTLRRGVAVDLYPDGNPAVPHHIWQNLRVNARPRHGMPEKMGRYMGRLFPCRADCCICLQYWEANYSPSLAQSDCCISGKHKTPLSNVHDICSPAVRQLVRKPILVPVSLRFFSAKYSIFLKMWSWLSWSLSGADCSIFLWDSFFYGQTMQAAWHSLPHFLNFATDVILKYFYIPAIPIDAYFLLSQQLDYIRVFSRILHKALRSDHHIPLAKFYIIVSPHLLMLHFLMPLTFYPYPI